ncbi:dihydroorotate dehydrogenase-like protein [Puteibacter caeruleilacunae]|nr:dihydroorotate dehydrogenase-like protein [Puteibacter caeruleilacunae]
MSILTTNYLGLELINPLVVGSSGLTDNFEKIKAIQDAGAGAVVLKSLFEEEIIFEMEEKMHEMHGRSIVFPENYDFLNADLEEDSIRKYLRLIRECKADLEIPIIASINCISSQKWTYLAEEIEKAGADALELNIFLLPSDVNLTAEAYRKTYFDIIDHVREKTRLPLSIKISNYSSELAKFIAELADKDIQGLTLFNKAYAPDFDIDKLTLTSGHVLSSPGDLSLPLRWTALMANRITKDIAATTGVHDGNGLIKVLLAGASSAHVVSTLYKNGIQYIEEMIEELENWMKRHDFKHIDDFKGKLAVDENKDPAEYERVQFYRNFRAFVY